MERRVVVPVEDTQRAAEPDRASWSIILESALRVLPLLALALPATLIVAYSYAEGYAGYFRIPSEFIRVSPQDATIPFTWAFAIVMVLLWFGHQTRKYGALPALRMHLARIRGVFFLLVVVIEILLVRDGRNSLLDMCVGLVIIYLIFWGVPALLRWCFRLIAKLLPRGNAGLASRMWRSISSALGVVMRHLFGAAPKLRGSLVSSWYVVLVLLAMAYALLWAVPYFMGIGSAYAQAAYGTVGGGQSDKQAIVAVYGDKVFLARIEGRKMRAVVMRNLADVKDVEVRREATGRLHW
jgi:hypothetical protein